jgi:hypothetical protein
LVAAGVLAAVTYTVPMEEMSYAASSSDRQSELAYWRAKVKDQRVRAVKLSRALGGHFRPGKVEMKTRGIPYLQWLYGYFKKKAKRLAGVKRERFPKLRCIHRLEGSWTAYNPAGYYGGFQMDWNFMRAWGDDKLAKYDGRDARAWKPKDQMAVASRAVARIGFSPWPNTARACGLL